MIDITIQKLVLNLNLSWITNLVILNYFVKIVIRHEVVSAVNLVGKNLIQSEGMLTDVQTIVFYAL